MRSEPGYFFDEFVIAGELDVPGHIEGMELFYGRVMDEVLCMGCEKWGVKIQEVMCPTEASNRNYHKALGISALKMP